MGNTFGRTTINVGGNKPHRKHTVIETINKTASFGVITHDAARKLIDEVLSAGLNGDSGLSRGIFDLARSARSGTITNSEAYQDMLMMIRRHRRSGGRGWDR